MRSGITMNVRPGVCQTSAAVRLRLAQFSSVTRCQFLFALALFIAQKGKKKGVT
jgi:hypothetical protein